MQNSFVSLPLHEKKRLPTESLLKWKFMSSLLHAGTSIHDLSNLLQLYASKATLDPNSSSFCVLLRGYPQWKELLLPVLKHHLGSLRLRAVRGERRYSQLVITAL